MYLRLSLCATVALKKKLFTHTHTCTHSSTGIYWRDIHLVKSVTDSRSHRYTNVLHARNVWRNNSTYRPIKQRTIFYRSQWPRGLRRGSAAARLLRLLVRIPTGGTDVCRECCVCCQVEVSEKRWLLVRGVLPTVVRRRVWSRNLVNEEALAHWGAVAPKTNKQTQPFLCVLNQNVPKKCRFQSFVQPRIFETYQWIFHNKV
jgi:hypothetical protein